MARTKPDFLPSDLGGYALPHENYVGLKNGKCVFIASKMADPRVNARHLAEMANDGLDILTVPHGKAMRPYYDSMQGTVRI